jgi:large subunit ribosomal protein L24
MPKHIRKGDTVIITAGDLRGQTGVVSRVIPEADRVIVQGLNLHTRRLKPNRLNPQGGVVTRESPIHISNVSPLVDGRATRVRFQTRPDGSKVRVAARTGKELGVVHGPRDAAPSPKAAVAAKPAARKKTSKKSAPKAAPKVATAGASKKKTSPRPAKKAGAKKSES